MRKLIINADDFGLTGTVNNAIIDTYQNGVLSSTTLMVNASASSQAVELAKSNPNLGVGLHFNLTLGRPISSPHDVASLVDNKGFFFPRKILNRKLFIGAVKTAHIECELRAQFRRFLSFDMKPTHIDSHQHVHAFPQIFDAIALLCKQENLAMRSLKILPVKRSDIPIGRRFRQFFLQRMLNRNEQRWPENVNGNSDLASVFDLGEIPEDLNSKHYQYLLDRTEGDVVELMVHPATNSDSLEGLTQIGKVSVEEYKYLMSGELLKLLTDSDFVMRNFANAWDS